MRAATRYGTRFALLVAAVCLPFAVLLRGSVWLYGSGRMGTWGALTAAVAATTLVLALYAALAARRAGGRIPPRRLLQGVALLVCAYCGYGLVYLSGDHAKGDAVRAEYRSLHPLLRLAVSTLVLADGQALVTDAARSLDDYAAMGLPANRRSLHLRQPTGWAHAVDLRTHGRSELRNGLVRAYFAMLGFRTLRHGGTADHLHVSLPAPQDPAPDAG